MCRLAEEKKDELIERLFLLVLPINRALPYYQFDQMTNMTYTVNNHIITNA